MSEKEKEKEREKERKKERKREGGDEREERRDIENSPTGGGSRTLSIIWNVIISLTSIKSVTQMSVICTCKDTCSQKPCKQDSCSRTCTHHVQIM